jgi:RNA recognition motif-containing protein
MNIFVASLNYGVTSEELQSVFEAYGEVTSARVITDRDSGRSKGFGFVEMADDASAQNAIAELNESSFEGRTIIVKVAEDRPQRNDRRY